VLFRLRLARSLSWRRLGAAVACVVIGLAGTALPALVVAGLLAVVLVVLIVWEDRAARERRRRGEPTPLERLDADASEAG
jgi:Flp pilus assembly protein TadB